MGRQLVRSHLEANREELQSYGEFLRMAERSTQRRQHRAASQYYLRAARLQPENPLPLRLAGIS
jgi:hypothetical protein